MRTKETTNRLTLSATKKRVRFHLTLWSCLPNNNLEGLGQGLNPYAGSAFEDRAEAEDKLATSIVDTRAKLYSSENAKI